MRRRREGADEAVERRFGPARVPGISARPRASAPRRPAPAGAQTPRSPAPDRGRRPASVSTAASAVAEALAAAGELPPQIALQHRQDLRRQKPRLGEQVPAPLAAIGETLRERRVEEDDRLAATAPVLVKPSESTSTPARHVASPGVQPRWASALASCAPSMWELQPRLVRRRRGSPPPRAAHRRGRIRSPGDRDRPGWTWCTTPRGWQQRRPDRRA